MRKIIIQNLYSFLDNLISIVVFNKCISFNLFYYYYITHYNESYYLTNKGTANIKVHWALLYADVEKHHIIIIDSLNYNNECLKKARDFK